MNHSQHQHLLDQALTGDPEALGNLLEHYRAYLTVLAKNDLGQLVQRSRYVKRATYEDRASAARR